MHSKPATVTTHCGRARAIASDGGQLGGWAVAFLVSAIVILVSVIGLGLYRAMQPPNETPPPSSLSLRTTPVPPQPTRLDPPQLADQITTRPPAVASRQFSPEPLQSVALNIQPDHAVSADNAAGVKAYHAGEINEAVQFFDLALTRHPDHPAIRHNMASATAAIGWRHITAGEPQEAVRQFRTAIEYDRTEASFYAGLGAAYQLQHEPERAIEAVRAAVALAPTRAKLYEQLGDLLYQNNELEEAISLLTMGIERATQPDRLSSMLARIAREQSVQADFQETGTRHFFIQFEGGENRDAAYEVLDLLELAYRDVGQAFSYYPEREVTVILYSREQFRDITQTPGWTKGVYDGKIRLPVGGSTRNRQLLLKVIYHEYTHAVVHALTANRLPTWLNEGLAVYFEGLASGNLGSQQGPTLRLSQAQVFPLSSLHGSFLGFSSAEAEMAYAQSSDVTRLLIDRYGLYRVKDLLEALGSNQAFDQAFQNAFFLAYPEFEHLWRNTLTS